jgi:putative inorganic carbon (hco3(-)) transporter
MLDRSLRLSFYLLMFLVPLILYPKTSEIFEFNKIVTVYAFTGIIVGLWLIKMTVEKKVIFRRSILDVPLILFLSAMGISTLISLDPRTSLFGYYSRFNGGLLSLLSYSLLYWAYVSNMRKRDTLTSFLVLFATTMISSVWAIFEHFGHSFSCLIFPDFKVFDNSCWVQDVQNRVYSTFGQPNWLAAWLAAIIPLTWVFGIWNKEYGISKEKMSKNYIQYSTYNILAILFFITLLFTKSRSGILAFAVSYFIFWSVNFYFNRQKIKKIIFPFLFLLTGLSFVILLIGTPWTPNLSGLVSKRPASNVQEVLSKGPALETGGTESGTIRKIVWKGAFNIWRSYPVFGTGLETFAFSYYNFRPAEHNLTSEWDYLYNKAHNEYLNFMATTGTAGTLSYAILIAFSLLQLIKFKSKSDFNIRNNKLINYGLPAGYITILITNFFGFSTVPINLLFFLFPAFALTTLEQEHFRAEDQEIEKIDIFQKVGILLLTTSTLLLLHSIYSYWHSDLSYSLGNQLNASGHFMEAVNVLKPLTSDRANEPVYWDELSNATANLAVYYSENSDNTTAKKLADEAYIELKKAIDLSPASVTIKRKSAVRLISLTAIDPSYLLLAKNILEDAIRLAPTDAKLRYNLGLTYLRTGDYDNAIKTIKETIELKPDYELAHYALALMYIDQGQKDNARYELNYIIKNLNPGNKEAKRELNELQ